MISVRNRFIYFDDGIHPSHISGHNYHSNELVLSSTPNTLPNKTINVDTSMIPTTNGTKLNTPSGNSDPTNLQVTSSTSESSSLSTNNEHDPITKPLSATQTIISPTTAVSSPRLVIETNTNVDSLDDGYHWRKYGQKTVKGSPFPRSYYKCTEKGCSVKKQVEQNGTSIVNTYEGTHTHLAPAMDDNAESVKKRRNRRSEGQEFTPFKRIHTSLDDLPNDVKSGISSPGKDTGSQSTSTNSHFHTPMPIGSMGSILHHTSHLQSSISYLGAPPLPNLYSTSDSHTFSTLSAIGSGPKGRIDSSPALAPLHSFSHTTEQSPSFQNTSSALISINSLSPKSAIAANSTETL